MPLSTEQYKEAVRQMIVSCNLKLEAYEPVSARSLLNDLGYGPDVDEILAYIAQGGFSYCLDHTIEQGPNHDKYPPQDACWWGPDQMKSRLRCI